MTEGRKTNGDHAGLPPMAPRFNPRPWLWFGAIGAGLVALIGVFGVHASSAAGVSDRLGGYVRSALEAKGYDFVAVEMEGQRAVLTGAAPDAAALQDITATALSAAGPGGRWAGGITSVDSDNLVVGAPISPYVWEAVRQGDSVVLRGYAPTARIERQIIDQAARLFRGEVTDQMELAPGAPETANWAGIAIAGLQQLARLNRGQARLVDDQFVLMGEADAQAHAELLAFYGDAANGLPAPYQAIFDVTTAGAGLGITELGDLDVSGGDPAACTEAFERIMRSNVINFASGSAEINANSFPLLDNLGRVARRCDAAAIEVSGHTDNLGTPELNRQLSQSRAEAVVSYLADRGVRRDRMSALGMGSSAPRASNATPAGQAANRRIEFVVR
jgi:outer membrane protein OmpA-like peptidoglycan-associated protein